MAQFFKVLDLSTGHLSEKERWFITSAEPFVVHAYRYGWLVYVPSDELFDDWLDELEFTDENDALRSYVNLVAAVIYANSLGADYILFDADGDRNDDLWFES